MELVSLICAEAAPGPSGRLDIHGVFSELFAPGFPARQDRLVLVALLQWDPAESGRIGFEIDLLAPDGDGIFRITGHTDVQHPGARLPPARTQLVLPLHNVVFPVPGRYRFSLAIGDRLCDGPSLFVCELEGQPE